ncbi:MAG TPA: right-handed parallel beta-helix repeat-containing protein [Candidatus Dependentiae bacterium]|nr:right-handed parallel beta-helix repeat-containing protein [Candidatus Dependentiae bacterium]HRQ62693.1 right-handed parallel beta-helix repeat-containing protein [Candidatus Dependentiae bacterium]
MKVLSYIYVLILLLVSHHIHASCGNINPQPAENLHGLTFRIGTEVDDMSSQVCDIESTVDVINTKIDHIIDGISFTISVTLTGEAVSGCDYLITQTQIPYVANKPGVHCLVENIHGGFAGAAAITITSSCVTLDMMDRFIDGEGTSLIGINVSGANDVIIKDGTIKNTTSNGIFIGSGVSGKERITVNNVHIANATSGAGIVINSGANMVFEGCNIYNCAAEGMQIFGTVTDLVIRACIASQNAADGFWVSSSSVNNCIFENTIAENNGADGFNISGSNCQITNCTSASNTSAGIRAAAGTSAQTLMVCNNLVYANGTDLVNVINSDLCLIPASDFKIAQHDIPLTIDTPGVWSVAEDLEFSSGTAITITTSYVTLDLYGHTIDAQHGGTLGVKVNAGAGNVIVQNGKIVNGFSFSTGIDFDGVRGSIRNIQINDFGNGISIGGNDNTVQECTVSNGTIGIAVTAAALRIIIQDCITQQNSNSGYFINTSSNDWCIADCKALSNAGGFVIAGDNGLMTACYAVGNSGTGFDIDGDNCQLRDSSAINNAVGIDGTGAVGLVVCNNIANNNGTDLINVPNSDLCDIADCGCDFEITQDDIPYTITQPGTYCVSELISFIGTGTAISIISDNVVLDLDNNIIQGDGSNNSFAISVVGEPSQAIIIQNGTIVNFDIGIYAFGGSFINELIGVTIQNITIQDVIRDGIRFTGGVSESIIQDCFVCNVADGNGISILNPSVFNLILNCNVELVGGTSVSEGNGFRDESVSNTYDGCFAGNCNRTGFYLNSSNSVIKNCQAIDCNQHGFHLAEDGDHLLIQNCTAKFCSLRGYFIEGPEVLMKECIADRCNDVGFVVDTANTRGDTTGTPQSNVCIEDCISFQNAVGGYEVRNILGQAEITSVDPVTITIGTFNIGQLPPFPGPAHTANSRGIILLRNECAGSPIDTSFLMRVSIADTIGSLGPVTVIFPIFPSIGSINSPAGFLIPNPFPSPGTWIASEATAFGVAITGIFTAIADGNVLKDFVWSSFPP